MKFVYVIVAVAVLVSGYVFFMTGDSTEVVVDPVVLDKTSEAAAVSDGENPALTTEPAIMEDVVVEVPEVVEEHVVVNDLKVVDKTFTIDSFNYGYSQAEIRVKKGDVVTINLTNSSGFHDWVLDEFSAATSKIKQGDTTSVTFVADEKGTFEYYCSVGAHRAQGMVGTLIVE